MYKLKLWTAWPLRFAQGGLEFFAKVKKGAVVFPGSIMSQQEIPIPAKDIGLANARVYGSQASAQWTKGCQNINTTCDSVLQG